MSSVGVFRKVEMDEKSFFAYTLTQTDNSLQTSFSCPLARAKVQNTRFMRALISKLCSEADEDDDDDNDDDDDDEDRFVKKLLPFNSSPHFPSTRSGGESLLDHDGFCKLPVVPLFWCNNQEPDDDGFECGACNTTMLSVSYYACLQCENMFHKECVESPLEIKHPSHPFHSLQLCTPSKSHSYSTFCTTCGRSLKNMMYGCTTCELHMHPVCAMRLVPLVVDHPKSHPHPLNFFPTQDSLVCHICSLVTKRDPTYICIQCIFVTHKGCIGFPHVIRICRHPHRISFTFSLPYKKLSCGICRQQVNNRYGAYSCNECDTYFVHSKCALHPKVWDEKDLEGVLEEDDEIDDGEPFKRIADGIISHPFHSYPPHRDHNMRREIFKTYEEKKYCEGCALPIYEGQFYSCVKCKFTLHESCANAPRMKRHPSYPHPLKLVHCWGISRCSACQRDGNGFFYEHLTGCRDFKLDLRCASILEPFEYEGHKQHPLFLPIKPGKLAQCQVCKYEKELTLNCIECDYVLCFRCATLPYKVRYKHDEHFLYVCGGRGKEPCDQPDWCEICEGKIELNKEDNGRRREENDSRFYKCDDCCTTLHVECLLGKDFYIKPGNTIEVYHNGQSIRFEIRFNKSLTRKFCTVCSQRCPFPIFLEGGYPLININFCSFYCCDLSSYRRI